LTSLSLDTEKSINNRLDDDSKLEKFSAFAYIITNMAKYRWRTILTIIGIMVPIAFFIIFAAIGDGLDDYILSQSTEVNKEQYVKISEIVQAWTNVLLWIIAVMIIIIIGNTMLISTSRRRKEFGILRAVGISQEQILNIVLLEAFLLSFIGLVLGIIIGIWSAVAFDYMFWLDEGGLLFFAPAKINLVSIIIISIFTLLIGTLTALYPALKASRMKAIDILRFE
jgi:putative ABC transport system permease protein